MIKKDLQQIVSEEMKITQKEAKEIIECIFKNIKIAVAKGEKVSLVGFGTLEARERAEKRGTNPSNGEPMVIPATVVPYFKPGTAFKEEVKAGK